MSDGIDWCLICEQRPAEGTLRRIFTSSGAPVIADTAVPVARVCQVCADQHHGTPGEAHHTRTTVWEFILTDPMPDERA